MRGPAVLSRLGFDVPRLAFTLRTMLAACLALWVAWLLGLEHPQWSAMTVWAASQPTRGQLAEKSFFRFAGTVSGVVAGVILVMISVDRPYLLVGGLAIWTGLCAGIGNVQRGFVSYGTLLAGYSAAMVALLDTGNPAQHVLVLGTDRLLTVLTGVVAAFIMGWLLTPKGAEDPLAARMRRLTARLLRDLAGEERAPASQAELQAALSEIAAIDELLEPSSAGGLRPRRAVRASRAVLNANMSVLFWLNRAETEQGGEGPQGILSLHHAQPALQAALLRGAQALEACAPSETVRLALTEAADAAEGPLRDHLRGLASALEQQAGTELAADMADGAMVVLHRDWTGAWQAMVRTFLAMLAMGALWLTTGWSSGPYTLLGLAVMVSLFSTFDNPALIMRPVFFGQLMGGLGALACHWLAWPLAGSEAGLVAMMMPFILLGALLLAHRRTMASGFDYNMTVLLLLQPHYPLTGTFGHSVSMVLAVILAPVAAWAAFRLIYPVDGRARMAMLMAAQPDAMRGQKDRVSMWRARFYHRLLRLVRWSEKVGQTDAAATAFGLAVLNIGRAILAMQERAGDMTLPAQVRRSLTLALGRMESLAGQPERTQYAFMRAAELLRRHHDPAGPVVHLAAGDMAANVALLRGISQRSRPAAFLGQAALRQGGL
ncbi:FUSC family protein [Xanthobacter sp. TB0139]|uniref:FUSC family protein n=1 Tax=Xanthobacter sp. TB0139 TaxID=3459178 RepID=UPI004039AF10